MNKFRLALPVTLLFSLMVTLACGASTNNTDQPTTTLPPTPTVSVAPPTATPETPTSVPPTEVATPSGLTQQELDALQAELNANIEKWHQTTPSDYALEFSVSCFCPTRITAPVTIVVRDTNTIDSVTYVETGEPVVENLDLYLTVGAMFDLIQEAIDQRVARLTVSYDPELGYPTSAFIDRDFMMADEERGFTVSSFRSIDAPTLGEVQSRLNSHRALWESRSPSSYQVQYRRVCFCPTDLTSPVVVAVSDGVIDSVTYAETVEPVGEAVRDLFPSVAGMFDILQDAIDQAAARIRVDYDAELGYPVSIAIDYSFMMADEELGFSAVSLQ